MPSGEGHSLTSLRTGSDWEVAMCASRVVLHYFGRFNADACAGYDRCAPVAIERICVSRVIVKLIVI